MAFNPDSFEVPPTNPTQVGDQGERKVATAIAQISYVADTFPPSRPGCTSLLINKLRLPHPKTGKPTEIDHVVICPSKLIVIETKNWAGTISGEATDKEWTQIKSGGATRKYSNPVLQSRHHQQAVEGLLGLHVPVISIVVFVGDGMVKTSCSNVAQLGDLVGYIAKTAAEPGDVDIKFVAMKMMAASTEPAAAKLPSEKPPMTASASTARGSDLFEQLRAWRKRTAAEENLSPGYVLSDKTLQEIVDRQPATRGDLLGITGIGPAKADKYGPDILAILETEKAETVPSPVPPPPSPRSIHPATRPASARKPDVLGEAFKLAKDMFRNRNK